MNHTTLSLLLFIITLSLVTCALISSESADHLDKDFIQFQTALEHLEQVHEALSRADRVQSAKKRFCGKRLRAFVLATCGECEPGSNVSLTMLCCTRQCDMSDIIQVCCPNAFK
uniref:Uncharacterized protein n=1 Tax=Caenorhabditis japonica TaxID=281687 RepID=A0A8R1EM22_CAEJA